MPHRFLNFHTVLEGFLWLLPLQVVSLELDNSIRLQVSALLGSMLAVRTIDGKLGFWECVKVAISGVVLANFIGFFWCDYRAISLQSIRAYFVFFLFGFFSDILLRGVKAFGVSVVAHVPTVTKSAAEKFKNMFLK